MKNAWFIDCLLLVVGGAVVTGILVGIQNQPGYMDSEYYYVMAKLLFDRDGFSEPFIWNFINNPTKLPVPSFTYWMPFTSIVALLGMLLTGKDDWYSARILFFILSAGVPLLSYYLGWVFSQKRHIALLSGMFAWFPVFYTPYLVTTDAFVIYMYLGSAWFLLSQTMFDEINDVAFMLGVVGGLMHFSRADGFIWFSFSIFLLLIQYYQKRLPGKLLFINVGKVLLGYAVVMGVWYLRNQFYFGFVFPPGNQKLFWLRSYDDIFIFPPSTLSIESWLKQGIDVILRDRLIALGQNLLTFLAVQCEIYLLPLVLWGLWTMRKKWITKQVIGAWAILLVLMSLVFPFAGYRGGFFHAIAAFQPFLWFIAATGLASFVDWGVNVRGWSAGQAWKTFSISAVVLSLVLTIFVSYRRIIGNSLINPEWSRSAYQYQKICGKLRELGMSHDDLILVNNPVGFYLACNQPAVVIPSGGEKALRAVTSKFNAQYLILERNHPRDLEYLYQNQVEFDGYRFIYAQDDWQIFQTPNNP